MATAPSDQSGDVVAADFGDDLVLAEEFDQAFEQLVRVGGGGVVLPDFRHIAAGDVVEPQRASGGLLLSHPRLGLLALDALYAFGRPPGRGLG